MRCSLFMFWLIAQISKQCHFLKTEIEITGKSLLWAPCFTWLLKRINLEYSSCKVKPLYDIFFFIENKSQGSLTDTSIQRSQNLLQRWLCVGVAGGVTATACPRNSRLRGGAGVCAEQRPGQHKQQLTPSLAALWVTGGRLQRCTHSETQ